MTDDSRGDRSGVEPDAIRIVEAAAAAARGATPPERARCAAEPVAVALASLVGAPPGWNRTVRVGARHVTLANLLSRKAWDPAWTGVFLALAERLEDPAGLLRLLGQQAEHDVFGHRLCVVAQVAARIPACRRRPCAGEIHLLWARTFDLWWEHLTAHTGAVVDHLTAPLTALVRAHRVLGHRRIARSVLSRIRRALACQSWLRRCVGLAAVEALDLVDFDHGIAAKVRQLAEGSDPVVRASARSCLRPGPDDAGLLGIAGRMELILVELSARLQAVREEVADFPDDVFVEALHERLFDLGCDWLLEAAGGEMAALATGPAAATALPAGDLVLGWMWRLRREWEAAVSLAVSGHLRALARAAADAGPRSFDYWELRLLQSAAKGLGAGAGAALSAHVLPLLERALPHWDESVRREALVLVQGLGAAIATPEILARLRPLLFDRLAFVREEAARAVGALGPRAGRPDVLDALGDVVDRSEPMVFEERTILWAACGAIARLGAAAATPRIRATLRRHLDRGDLGTAAWAARGLRALAVPVGAARILHRPPDSFASVLAATEALGVEARVPPILQALVTEVFQGSLSPYARDAAVALAAIAPDQRFFWSRAEGRWGWRTTEDLARIP